MPDVYRLYIDESGDHVYSQYNTIKHRYLCLNGVIFSKLENKNYFSPGWTNLRRIFTTDPDFPAKFHYTDVIAGKDNFSLLKIPSIKNKFDTDYLNLLTNGDFTICSIVIDKDSHKRRYTQPAHPYHYCLNVLLERYVRFLISKGATGDVMAESRNPREDALLRQEFQYFYQNGSGYIRLSDIQNCLTSKDIKLKNKHAMVCGLEISDMLANPMKHYILNSYNLLQLSQNFTQKVLNTVDCKIRNGVGRNFQRTKIGFGIKLIT